MLPLVDHARPPHLRRAAPLPHQPRLGDGGDHRERLGLGPGPRLCVTNLAVLDFHPVSRRMRLLTTHPGVAVEEVVDETTAASLAPGREARAASRTAERSRTGTLMRVELEARVKQLGCVV